MTMAQGEERSAPAQDLRNSSSTCTGEENGKANEEKAAGEEGGASYGFLTSLSAPEAEGIQAQIMRQLEIIMVGQRGGAAGAEGEEEASIQEDLSVLNEYVWHLLTQEVANQERLKKELLEFLQANVRQWHREEDAPWLLLCLCRALCPHSSRRSPRGGPRSSLLP